MRNSRSRSLIAGPSVVRRLSVCSL